MALVQHRETRIVVSYRTQSVLLRIYLCSLHRARIVRHGKLYVTQLLMSKQRSREKVWWVVKKNSTIPQVSCYHHACTLTELSIGGVQ